jgi:pyruvate formate lyase activating enzyme
MQSGLVFNIQRYSIQDGPGIRSTVFIKGCPLRCAWCHNPESQSFEKELITIDTRCIHCGECVRLCHQNPQVLENAITRSNDENSRCIKCGDCVDACPTGARQMIGQRMSVEDVVTEVMKDRLFYDESGGGVTISGGEPLAQPDFVMELVHALHSHGIHTALDTSGFAPLNIFTKAVEQVDLVLYDLKLMDEDRHRHYTGVSNRSILNNLHSLGRMHKRIWLRIPLIPGVNDDQDTLDQMAEFAASIPGILQVNILPYHEIGLDKNRRLGREYTLGDIASPAPDHLNDVAERFRSYGMCAVTGGGTYES